MVDASLFVSRGTLWRHRYTNRAVPQLASSSGASPRCHALAPDPDVAEGDGRTLQQTVGQFRQFNRKSSSGTIQLTSPSASASAADKVSLKW